MVLPVEKSIMKYNGIKYKFAYIFLLVSVKLCMKKILLRVEN